jgi:hypothetical protein
MDRKIEGDVESGLEERCCKPRTGRYRVVRIVSQKVGPVQSDGVLCYRPTLEIVPVFAVVFISLESVEGKM